jgi:hypothetical protein
MNLLNIVLSKLATLRIGKISEIKLVFPLFYVGEILLENGPAILGEHNTDIDKNIAKSSFINV